MSTKMKLSWASLVFAIINAVVAYAIIAFLVYTIGADIPDLLFDRLMAVMFFHVFTGIAFFMGGITAVVGE